MGIVPGEVVVNVVDCVAANIDVCYNYLKLIQLYLIHKINPIFGYRVKITPDIYIWFEGIVLMTPKR